jgi:DNA-binding protein HU-beta
LRRLKNEKEAITKDQIVSHFEGKFEISKRTASAILSEVAALAVSETKKDGSFTRQGCGFQARMGRNPATGEKIKIPAKTVVKMRIAKAAKEAIVPKNK